jgi:hypothetical protein
MRSSVWARVVALALALAVVVVVAVVVVLGSGVNSWSNDDVDAREVSSSSGCRGAGCNGRLFAAAAEASTASFSDVARLWYVSVSTTREAWRSCVTLRSVASRRSLARSPISDDHEDIASRMRSPE